MSIEDNKYLYDCIRYIHNNPEKAGITSKDSYRWSSYREYVLDSGISDRSYLYSIVGSANDFVVFSIKTDSTEIMDFETEELDVDEGIRIIKDVTGIEYPDGGYVKRLCKKDRDEVLRKMKEKGFSPWQLERITGISQSIIKRA